MLGELCTRNEAMGVFQNERKLVDVTSERLKHLPEIGEKN